MSPQAGWFSDHWQVFRNRGKSGTPYLSLQRLDRSQDDIKMFQRIAQSGETFWGSMAEDAWDIFGWEKADGSLILRCTSDTNPLDEQEIVCYTNDPTGWAQYGMELFHADHRAFRKRMDDRSSAWVEELEARRRQQLLETTEAVFPGVVVLVIDFAIFSTTWPLPYQGIAALGVFLLAALFISPLRAMNAWLFRGIAWWDARCRAAWRSAHTSRRRTPRRKPRSRARKASGAAEPPATPHIVPDWEAAKRSFVAALNSDFQSILESMQERELIATKGPRVRIRTPTRVQARARQATGSDGRVGTTIAYRTLYAPQSFTMKRQMDMHEFQSALETDAERAWRGLSDWLVHHRVLDETRRGWVCRWPSAEPQTT